MLDRQSSLNWRLALSDACRDFSQTPRRSSLLFTAKAGRGALILNCLGKGKERLRVGEKESFQAQCMRDY
jgi:hypothetical protein